MRKLSLFTNNIIIYVEIPNESQKKPSTFTKTSVSQDTKINFISMYLYKKN
jgi:hypothetical protein